jgi:hypothetical protein
MRRVTMQATDGSAVKGGLRPYRRLCEDPRYDEIKRIIDEIPKEKMEELKMYIQRWSRDAGP